MSWLGQIWTGIRQRVRREIGFVRIMEWRNDLLMGPAIPRIRWSEDREVERAKREFANGMPAATVAVIVPTYKRPEQLLKAIDSILAQTFTDFVVMVIDDGGGLPALPDDPRVHAFSLRRNTGIAGVVRNVGIRTSRSKYVAFLDDDNSWHAGHLEHCIGPLERGADLVYTAIARHTLSGRKVDVLSAPFDRRAFTQESWIDTSAIVIRRTDGVYFSRLPRGRHTIPGEDWEFVYRLSRRARVEHIPVVTVDYLVNPESFYTPWTETATR
jgi:glycosyltransferase involved in cell wall biosynthesis